MKTTGDAPSCETGPHARPGCRRAACYPPRLLGAARQRGPYLRRRALSLRHGGAAFPVLPSPLSPSQLFPEGLNCKPRLPCQPTQHAYRKIQTVLPPLARSTGARARAVAPRRRKGRAWRWRPNPRAARSGAPCCRLGAASETPGTRAWGLGHPLPVDEPAPAVARRRVQARLLVKDVRKGPVRAHGRRPASRGMHRTLHQCTTPAAAEASSWPPALHSATKKGGPPASALAARIVPECPSIPAGTWCQHPCGRPRSPPRE